MPETELANISPESLQSLKLPATFDHFTRLASSDIDAFLSCDKRPEEVFEMKLSAFRDAAQANLLTFRGSQIFDPVGEFPTLAWPSDLYIPGSADFKSYWFIPPPADHRYALAWTSPGSANQASSQTGELFSFAQLNPATNAGQFTDAGLGIFYNPPMTLGVVDLQAACQLLRVARWFLQIFPKLAAGYVDVIAQLILAAWQVIPGGFDLFRDGSPSMSPPSGETSPGVPRNITSQARLQALISPRLLLCKRAAPTCLRCSAESASHRA